MTREAVPQPPSASQGSEPAVGPHPHAGDVSTPAASPRGRHRYLLPWWTSRRVSRLRLEVELAVWEAEVGSLLAAADAPEHSRWGSVIEDLLARCRQALAQKEVEKAWHCYKAARRTELYLLEPDQVRDRAQAIQQEADEKLKSSWRGKSIAELLKDDRDVHRVVAATKLLDEHHDNTYRRMAIVESRLTLLSAATLAALVGWISIASLLGGSTLQAGMCVRPLVFWLTVTLLGFMGAIVSGFATTYRSSPGIKIPDQLLSSSLVSARLALGSLSAVVVAILLSSGIITLGDRPFSYELILAAAFVSGFSEQLVVRGVQSVLGGGSGT